MADTESLEEMEDGEIVDDSEFELTDANGRPVDNVALELHRQSRFELRA